MVGVTEPTITYINEAGVPETVVEDLRDNRDIANAIELWSQSLRSDHSAGGLDVFARTKWRDAQHVFAQISQCAWAAENDDVLSTLADVTEGLAFQKSAGRSARFELNDDVQEDMWNMWAEDVDLDSRVREMFRELYKVSQFYAGVFWERKTYVVDDPGLPGEQLTKRRRRTFNVVVPSSFTVFDPTKVVPVGGLLFGQERFAYIADDVEQRVFEKVLAGQVADPKVKQMLEGPYTPSDSEQVWLGTLGLQYHRMWLLRKTSVFRHSLTRASYERFASVRLKSGLETLRLKDALRASDRAALQGNANFIVVITKGTDKLPAKQAEIDNLKASARVIAKLPVLVGDHRLNVEIVSPSIDKTLTESRWQVLDSRLVFQALQSFMPIVQGGTATTGVSEMSRVVSAGIENRRGGIGRALEAVAGTMLEVNPQLSEKPRLTFAPKHVSLEFSADVINAVLKVRDRGDISRETMLEELDFSQDVEARRRAREKEGFDPIFQSGTPYSSPATNPYAPGGPSIEGGRPPGAESTKDSAK